VIKRLVKDKDRKILFDQIRSFDKQRLLRKLGEMAKKEIKKVNQIFKEKRINIHYFEVYLVY